jgi:3-hydroxyisobutyrate dehydrogenase-like beta-hydroxyacid dehydrogenase
MNVTFLGLGNMGNPMARHLLAAGHHLTVFNRTPDRTVALASAGASVAATLSEAVQNAEVVITMLADDRAVLEVTENFIPNMKAGAIHACMSTISPDCSRRLMELHHARGQVYIAAPVFGRPEAAEARKLWVLAAGSARHIETCRPLFEAMGRALTILGDDPARANIVKISGNFLIAATIEALGEAFALVKKSGVEPGAFLEIINGALFNSPLYANYGGIIANQRFDPPGFKLKLGFKDARLVLDAARNAEVPMPLASLIGDNFLSALATGKADLDWSALAQIASERAGF